MAPKFITKHILPCSGTPVHKLTCSHTIHTSFLHPTTSKCAPNCAAVGLATTAEPSFLCPICYESVLRDDYQQFLKRCKRKIEEAVIRCVGVESIVHMFKTSYEHGSMGEEGWTNKVHTWCLVFIKQISFDKIVKERYSSTVELEKMRGCKAIDGEFEKEVEVMGWRSHMMRVVE